jgi:hypothetical protein|tara:strand:+ start:1199 stop:1477 length:279 start_codon:yes stop_codon:yes gene_type:complete
MTEGTNFGELTAEELSIGDIVEWSKWDIENEGWSAQYGIILDIKNEIKASRLISISRVMPLNKPGVELEFFTMSLRLVSRSNEENNEFEIKN